MIRAGTPEDSPTLVARRIGASPDYLARHGPPQSLEDLAQHQAVGYLSSRTARSLDWHFVVDGEDRFIHMRERLIVNDTDAYVTCGLEGLGIICAGRAAVRAVSEEPAPVAHRARVRRLGGGGRARGAEALAHRRLRAA